MGFLQNAWKFMDSGGTFMWVIACVAIVGIIIAAERFMALVFKYNLEANAFMDQIRKLILANHIDRAIKLCAQARDASLARVVKAGLQKANKGGEEIQSAVDEAILEVVPEITKRTDYLFLVAQIATYLGLLGTIFGMIDAFDAVANAPPEEKATALAAAISVAMNTTALGLVVAVPASVVVGLLKGLTNKILAELDLHSAKLTNLLGQRAKGQLSAE